MSAHRCVVAVVVTLLVAGTACGGSRSTDRSAATTSTAASATTTFGEMASPCGPGQPAGAPDQGVTDTTINIGFGDDAGFSAQPGLDHDLGDAMRAIISWCNKQGGIGGRKIVGTYYDGKATEVVNVMTDACKKEFFLVGQGYILDNAAEGTRQQCGLPSVAAFSATPVAANAPLRFETSPVPADYTSISHATQLKELFPTKIKNAAVMYGDYPPMVFAKDRVEAGFSSLGYDFKCAVQYNVQGEPDWRPFVQRLKDCGAEMVYFSGATVPTFENVLEAASLLNYHPVWFGEPNLLDDQFAKWNTNGFADNVYFRMYYGPLFEANDIRAVHDYFQIVQASGGSTGFLGEAATGSFLLWASAAKACGASLTRSCVLSELRKVKSWTAGGLHAPSDPAENLPSDCGALIKVQGTQYKRITPAKAGTYECDPKFNYHIVDGPAASMAKLDSNRIAHP